jgi:acetyl-CoA carboxylase biotin carboxyl carrier protein
MMTIDEIRELIRVVLETGIQELEFQQGDSRVKIRRAMPPAQEVVLPAVLPVSMTASATSLGTTSGGAHPPLSESPVAAQTPAAREDERDVVVKSPIVGTYYDAPAPGTPSFVRVGDRVEPKQVLCIIESMKLMNEIEAEIAGTLVAKLVENGRPVEYGESLFTIRPV